MRLVVRESGIQLAETIMEALTFGRRLRGLMLTASLPEGCGLLLRPCRSVHTFLMKYAIDVVHLDEEERIVGLEHELRPGRIGAVFAGTRSVVELPAGTLRRSGGIEVGQTVQWLHHYTNRRRLL
ncbi:DUF192 domain-containing protein [Paenibacillus sp. YYML68]|uniref:DUF192 domain-containing protein n=1 Tax=Paenibacillus sp. YYML68 TaxID=2909250 RepID=UPI0024902292|nr:DUF192 domain-containing protein [Paenibacillus sp. YYML68]